MMHKCCQVYRATRLQNVTGSTDLELLGVGKATAPVSQSEPSVFVAMVQDGKLMCCDCFYAYFFFFCTCHHVNQISDESYRTQNWNISTHTDELPRDQSTHSGRSFVYFLFELLQSAASLYEHEVLLCKYCTYDVDFMLRCLT